MLRFLPKSKVGGIPGLEAYHKNTPNVNACAEIHFQIKISDLSASTNMSQPNFYSTFGLVEALKSEIFIWKWILAQASTLAILFHGKLQGVQALGSHQPSIWEEGEAFYDMRDKIVRRPGSSPVLCQNNACGLEVWLSSTVYLNLGLNLFHSNF